jgi:DNA invertase Pin-like site-specific DNA recombinase
VKVGIYARVSTTDKDQNPETQLMPLRAFVQAQGWTIAGEFVDQASAKDLRNRVAWRRLLEDASRRKVDMILVWKLDRSFRSVLDASTTLQNLRRWGTGLRSYTEPMIDTASGSPWGEMLFNLLATFAQFERSLLSERTRAGMARARAEGKHIGRPRKGVIQSAPRQALENTGLLSANGAPGNGSLS